MISVGELALDLRLISDGELALALRVISDGELAPDRVAEASAPLRGRSSRSALTWAQRLGLGLGLGSGSALTWAQRRPRLMLGGGQLLMGGSRQGAVALILIVIGWSLAGHWLVIGWSLAGHWQVIGWSLAGHWQVIGWSLKAPREVSGGLPLTKSAIISASEVVISASEVVISARRSSSRPRRSCACRHPRGRRRRPRLVSRSRAPVGDGTSVGVVRVHLEGGGLSLDAAGNDPSTYVRSRHQQLHLRSGAAAARWASEGTIGRRQVPSSLVGVPSGVIGVPSASSGCHQASSGDHQVSSRYHQASSGDHQVSSGSHVTPSGATSSAPRAGQSEG